MEKLSVLLVSVFVKPKQNKTVDFKLCNDFSILKRIKNK